MRIFLYSAAVLLLASFFCPLPAPARAQDTQSQDAPNQGAPGQDENVLRVNVNLVMLDATIKNKSGHIMNDLKKEDFELREDGVVQKLDVFSRDELPLNVALVLDLSDSIGPKNGPMEIGRASCRERV